MSVDRQIMSVDRHDFVGNIGVPEFLLLILYSYLLDINKFKTKNANKTTNKRQN